MYPSVRVGEHRNVIGQEGLVDANFSNIQRVRACQETYSVNAVIKCPIRTPSHVCAIIQLGLDEGIVQYKADLANELGDQDNLEKWKLC